jgi:hypothetical protein
MYNPPPYNTPEASNIDSILEQIKNQWHIEDQSIDTKYEQMTILRKNKMMERIKVIKNEYEHDLKNIQSQKNQHRERIMSRRLTQVQKILGTTVQQYFFNTWFT